MRITLRYKNVKEYWLERWDQIKSDEAMKNEDVYPLKYAELTIKDKKGKILEAGCGAGRILRYYHNLGYEIIGIDYIETAIKKLKDSDPSLNISVGDITNLKFSENSFRYILAFGLYHNLEKELSKSISETKRVLEKDGFICASFRADNIQTRIVDWLALRKDNNYSINLPKEFHKMNLTKKEFIALFENEGFKITYFGSVVNMPIFYKFKIFRHSSQKIFNEAKGREFGYKLSFLGTLLHKVLISLFENQFCNLYVLIAQKN